MQQRSKRKQRNLTDAYSLVLKNSVDPYLQDIKITPYNPYPELEVLDQKIWDAMSEDEKRKWIQENTEVDLDEQTPTVETPAQTQPTQAKLINAVPISFPDKVRDNVKRALEYRDKFQIKCGGKSGLEVANNIMNNQNMGLKQLRRIHSYLKKNDIHRNKPFNEGCNVIDYHAWGGYDMFEFLDQKLKDFEAWLN